MARPRRKPGEDLDPAWNPNPKPDPKLFRGHGKRRFTVEEVRKQLEFIEGLMVLGASNGSVVAQARRPPNPAGGGGLGISLGRAYALISRIMVKWEEEDRVRSTARRAEASRRIMRQIQNCQGRRDPRNPNVWLEKPNHKALIGYERELMKLQGTAAPIEIDINVRHSETMVAVFSRYSLETLQKLHAAAKVKKTLAAAYLAEHPDAREVVEAEGVTVE